MVTTAGTMSSRRDRTFLWGIVASILLHAILFVPGIRDVVERAIDIKILDRPEEAVDVPLEFTLVSPPEIPSPTEEEPSRFRSTEPAEASDEDPADTGSDVPHREGRLPFPDNVPRESAAQGGAQSSLPPMPEEQEGLGDALARSKFEKVTPPPQTPDLRGPSFADESMDFYEPGSARASIGGIQLSTTEWDFAPYLLDLKRRIKQKWIPPIAFTTLGAIHGYTWVRFRIYPDGHMEAAQVVETEGHDSLHRSSFNAVKGAAPFRELPDDFPDPFLEIEFGFYYLLPGDENKYFRNGRFVRKDEGSQQ